ncbi:pentatricopeptide repeat-containing protein mitochondrial [Dorcoceras hygrometricum]|uniref:Pentatricopeptide repeat-containing protein mitochondrial n=1 Tax=Dorcoceras hygrometricum TaxID=472368 RepID=A0A2Z7CP30_9LAMI|nr:pentatricopeptide repeat-containing protein mitochondrial [Dorcoceras hygrometricum]
MADAGMVQMFKALESSGLRGFLGCSSAIYEAALVEFLHNASVRDDKVVSVIQGKTWCLTLNTYCKKREKKFEFRLLKDILAKTVKIKDGSFDAVTHERCLMMSAIHGGVKVNWGRLLFNIFKDMVTPASKQARGFAVQICILLKGAPDLEFDELKDFLTLKILTVRTVGMYFDKNKNIIVEEVVDEPVAKVAKKALTKRRPALVVVQPAAKNKRTTVGRPAPAKENLAIVTVAQNVEPISVIPAAIPHAQHRRAPKRKLVLQEGSDD